MIRNIEDVKALKLSIPKVWMYNKLRNYPKYVVKKEMENFRISNIRQKLISRLLKKFEGSFSFHNYTKLKR